MEKLGKMLKPPIIGGKKNNWVGNLGW